jgi:hypothetical protein
MKRNNWTNEEVIDILQGLVYGLSNDEDDGYWTASHNDALHAAMAIFERFQSEPDKPFASFYDEDSGMIRRLDGQN